MAEPVYFASASAFGAWLREHGETETELLVGFHKVGTGQPSMTWPESVDEALCVGWIDAVRKRVDEQRYQIRFTRRKPGSTWSAINIARVAELTAQGRMQPSGIAAFARRVEHKSRIYAYEQKDTATLSPEDEKLFRRHKQAWAYFEQQPPGYRHKLLWRITSAKRPETRAKRLAELIEASAQGRRLD